MKEEDIKKAFSKVKEDIFNLGQEISNFKLDFLEIRKNLAKLNKEFDEFLTQKLEQEAKDQEKTQEIQTSTLRQINPTLRQITSTHLDTSTDNYQEEALKTPNIDVSIGNDGVSTDRQTDRQTDTNLGLDTKTFEISSIPQISFNNQINKNTLDKASEILSSLDTLKKELRLKIKRLTPQEMKIFSIIYQLESEQIQVDYPLLASKTTLSQSSIRDYIQRIIAKGIPISKKKIANKQVILNLSKDFKKIASLETILKLREL